MAARKKHSSLIELWGRGGKKIRGNFVDAPKNQKIKKYVLKRTKKHDRNKLGELLRNKKERAEGGCGRFFMCLESRWGTRGVGDGSSFADYITCTCP